MRIGVPKEIKIHGYRVGLSPSSVREVVAHGHSVVIERGAGAGIGMSDEQYVMAGATLAASAVEVFSGADMIVKVKEPQSQERRFVRPGPMLFTYLHLCPRPRQTHHPVGNARGCTP